MLPIARKWKEVPGPVKLFLLKALLLFVAWKALYLLVLQPGRIVDRPLTYFVSVCTTRTLNIFYGSGTYTTTPGVNPVRGAGEAQEEVMHIFRSNERVLSIGDPCNGLEVEVLYAGLILCLPATRRRRVLFLVTGVIGIEILNIIRCVGLVLVYLHRPEYLDFSHHYLFTFLVYAFIFWLWYLFAKEAGFAKKFHVHAQTS
jgi:exosortase/archaeosortase family protein